MAAPWLDRHGFCTKRLVFGPPAGEVQLIRRRLEDFDPWPPFSDALRSSGLQAGDAIVEINLFQPYGGYSLARTVPPDGRGARSLPLIFAAAREIGAQAVCVYTLAPEMAEFARKHGFREPCPHYFVTFLDTRRAATEREPGRDGALSADGPAVESAAEEC